MRALGIFLTVMVMFSLSACSSRTHTYQEAKEIALSQEKTVASLLDENSPFILCLFSELNRVEQNCDIKGSLSDEFVLQFNSKGKILQVYSELSSPEMSCVTREFVGRSCENPPLQNLFGIYSTSESDCY